MSANACPFCGAAPKENWTKKVRWFTCGTMVGPENTRHDQTIHCMTDEVARLTRERDEAINARNVIAKNIRTEMILKMQEVAKERDKARAEVARLKAGGCARDQRTTQFCAEAVALQGRVERLEMAGDRCACLLDAVRPNSSAVAAWYKAKEAKP